MSKEFYNYILPVLCGRKKRIRREYSRIALIMELLLMTAMTSKNFSQKNLPFYRKISDNIINPNYFFALST